MNRTLIDTILFVFFAVAMLAGLGPALDRWTTVSTAQTSAEAAAREELRQQHLAIGAQRACNSDAWELQPDGFTVQCFTHRGQRTVVVELKP